MNPLKYKLHKHFSAQKFLNPPISLKIKQSSFSGLWAPHDLDLLLTTHLDFEPC